MIWPWRRRQQPPRLATSGDAEEATEARRRAEEQLARTQEQTAEVRALADQLRRHRNQNHFAELFGRSFGGPR